MPSASNPTSLPPRSLPPPPCLFLRFPCLFRSPALPQATREISSTFDPTMELEDPEEAMRK
eukprot:3293722-Rhodomonas_salina.1